MSTRSRILRTVVITLGVVLAIEGCLQLLFRARNGQFAIHFERHRVVHIERRDDPRGYTYRAGFRDRAQGLTFDRFGLRVDPAAPPIAEGAPVVVAIGDSVPFGHGGADAESYPAQLDAMFRARGVPLRVINAGVQSYTLRQSIEHFRRDVLPHFRPVIVTVQAANDVALLLHHRGSWTPDRTWAPYGDDVLSTIVASSATLYYATLPFRSAALADIREPQARMIAHEERLLDDFIRFCGRRAIRVVLMPIDPFYYGRDREKSEHLSRWGEWVTQHDGIQPQFDAFNDAMIRVARRHEQAERASFFDTREYLDARDREPLYTDFIHYSAAGKRAIAEGLFDFLDAGSARGD